MAVRRFKGDTIVYFVCAALLLILGLLLVPNFILKDLGYQILNYVLAAMILVYLFGYLIHKMKYVRSTLLLLTIVEFVLLSLIALGLVRRESPYGEKASRKSIYSIDDNMFRFWYRFIPEYSSVIARGAADMAYRRMEPHLSDYMGNVFEEICKQYLWKLLLDGKSPVEFKELGRWWGTDPSAHSQAEIDIMGDQDKDTALFGECKWTNEKVDAGVLEKLAGRSKLFHYHKVYLYLFAKSGFTKGCIDKAKGLGNAMLVTYSDIQELLSGRI